MAAICAAVSLPVIGIYKQKQPDSPVYITPTFAAAQSVVRAGAHTVAMDGTPRPRPGGITLETLIARGHRELGVPVMADISCLNDALVAEQAGADLLATTLAGTTEHGRPATPGPDLELVAELVRNTHTLVVAEGRFHNPSQVAEAFACGAHAVVVGGAITRPQEITRRFVAALPRPAC